jgi:lipopolysaccharide/colanic/teichoic acid biosynthesis glycosyltransferase
MKRVIDIVGASAALLLLSPVIVAIAFAIWLTIGPPVFFSQVRPGLRAQPFRMVKFRTMRNAFDGDGKPLPDGERMTRLGAWLRATSLDELPEFWNVFKGEMSLVGPRPLLMEYLPLYTPRQARRHDVRPGITGWAQVNGRNSISWKEKLALDIWYVDHQSFWLDARILFLTLKSVLTRTGINADGEATMPRFTGGES